MTTPATDGATGGQTLRMTLTEIQHQVAPLFVVGPTTRNGITLIQRLLNSTRQVLVYGENAALVHHMTTLAFKAIETHRQFNAEFTEARGRFLGGQVDGWTSNLWPDTGAFANALCEGFYKAVMVYEQCTREYGYARWGVKNPLANPYTIPGLLFLMPHTRFVFIHRHLFDAAKSAKARQFISTEQDLIQFAALYQRNMHAVLNTPRPQTLIVKHEDLVDDPEPHLRKLEAFVGVEGIDRTVMQRRINTFVGAREQGRSDTGYIEPEPLTERERSVLVEHARPTLEQAGYL
ncbi:MAG: hypothetical protein GVY28_07820 [Alphaproteobacteria bacterium]|jgi:hypothetical protein|nr:hypothetical protein [Alphaproteobacteria bacterium]